MLSCTYNVKMPNLEKFGKTENAGKSAMILIFIAAKLSCIF